MQLVQVGSLQAVLTPVLAPREVERTVVLLHGWGAPGTDLVGLAQALDVPRGTQFVFLMAPHPVEGAAGPDAGRAWWHIDMMALQVARMTGQFDTLAAQVPEGLEEARDFLGAALADLEQHHGLVWERTYLGGFSQGAMLSMDYGLRSDVPLAGLLQLSGTVICEEAWVFAMKKRAGTRVFQSHSPDDPVLPFELAKRLCDHITQAKMVPEFVSFRGGHGIPAVVLQRLSAFLRAGE